MRRTLPESAASTTQVPMSVSETQKSGETASETKRATKSHKRLHRFLASWSRWLHIYLSMFGSVAILFFSVTGLTLNHSEWFFREHQTQVSANLNPKWLNNEVPSPSDWDESDYGHQVSKLEVAEFLRSQHQLKGAISDFLTFEDECEVTFQGPGYGATARIERATGDYVLDVTTNDLVTIMNDLHKGRHAGEAWSWVIDISAIIGSLVGLTGFVLIFFLRLRRMPGLITAALGGFAVWVFYYAATR